MRYKRVIFNDLKSFKKIFESTYIPFYLYFTQAFSKKHMLYVIKNVLYANTDTAFLNLYDRKNTGYSRMRNMMIQNNSVEYIILS